jgi:hypothetical protein
MLHMRSLAPVALAALLLSASCSTGPPSTGPGPETSPTGDPDLWRTDPSEPYAFVTPVPPLEGTPIDGTYFRDFTPGSKPIPCRRCAPYRLDRGPSTLEMSEGRFQVIHEGNDYRTEGHYLVDGRRLILFNDPECPETRGVYRWGLEGGLLQLEEVDDPCPFDLLRARYLSAAPWEAIYGT